MALSLEFPKFDQTQEVHRVDQNFGTSSSVHLPADFWRLLMNFWHWHGVHLPQHAVGDFPSQDGRTCTCVHMYISLLNEDNKFKNYFS